MKSIFILALAPLVSAQCGPAQDKPYPSGSTSCPNKSTADKMDAETGKAPGGNTAAACEALPCPASLLGDVALTTVTGTGNDGTAFKVGENIYGPFEAGFGETQANILKTLGCTDANVKDAYLEGGIDTHLSEQMVAAACKVTLPRTVDDTYISLIDECGGHTKEYHFHERLSCLYKEEGKHSTQVGKAMDDKFLYGKWEDYSTDTLPKLDACGGHFGVTPDSNGKSVYHYHVQTSAPFTIGCFGPAKNDAGEETLVTLKQCRAMYGGCTSDTKSLVSTSGTVEYKYWCPCYDADGSTVATKELAVFDDTAAVTCATCDSGTKVPTTSSGNAGGLRSFHSGIVAAAAVFGSWLLMQ